MSFRVREFQSIHNNPLNASTSKHQYSIPKAERFKIAKYEMLYRYYDLPSTNSRKAPSFGVSDRSSLFAGDKSIPPPTKYVLEDFLI